MKHHLWYLACCLFLPCANLSAQTPLGGTLNADQTLVEADSPYELTSDLNIATGVTLTIEAGVEVWFPSTGRDIIVNGTLVANGTAASKVRFWGNNSNGNIHGGGVLFYSTSSGNVLNHVIFEKLGDISSTWDASIYIDQAEVILMNTTILDTESARHVRLTPNTPSKLTFENNNIPYVNILNGAVTMDATWAVPDTAYLLEDSGNTIINQNVTVTLLPSTEIWFASVYNDIEVSGTLIADGTPTEPIRFLGVHSNGSTHGGGLNFFNTSSGNILDHVVIKKLGDNTSAYRASIYNDRAEVSISNTTIEDTESARHVRLTPNTPGKLTFENNNIPYINIINGAVTMDATWAVPDTAYLLEDSGNTTINQNVTVTLLPSTEIWFASIYNDIDVSGTLIADGTPTEPIRFLGIHSNGATHGGGINFYNTSSGNILDHVVIDKLGDNSSAYRASIYNDRAEVSISNTTIEDTESNRHIRLTPNTPSKLTFDSNNIPYVNIINGSVTADATWAVPDTAYFIEDTGDLDIDQNITVTLLPDTEVWFGSIYNDIDVSGTLIAVGTATKPIRFYGISSNASNHGGGVNFYNTSSGNVLDHVVFEKLGDNSGNWDASIYIDRAEVAISNTTILDTESNQHIRLTPNTPSKLTFDSNNIPYVNIINGSVTADATWAVPDTAYFIEGNGNINVEQNVTLTLLPDTEIWFGSVYNDIEVYGTLIADGTATEKIRFLGINSNESTHGGGLNFYNTSTGNLLNHTVLEQLGDNTSTYRASIYADLAELSISNSSIVDTESGFHMRATANTPSQLTFDNNEIPSVYVKGTVTTSAEWPLPDISYTLDNDLSIDQAATLTLKPGTEIWFLNQFIEMWVYGNLIAEGTPSAPIRFWGSNSNALHHGGGIYFYPGSTGSILNHTVLERLGDISSNWASGIYVYDDAFVSITNSTLFNMESNAMRLAATGEASFVNNCIYDIGNYGVFKNGSTPFNAINNYWGDISGPSPTGQGTLVTDNVLFDPWLDECESTAQNDIAVIQLLSPVTDCSLSNTVSVRIANVGTALQSGFQVAYSIDGNTPVYQTVNQNLSSGEILDIDFDNPINLSNLGTYDFQIFTLLVGDEQPGNDVLDLTIENIPPLEVELTGNTSSCAGEQILISTPYNPSYQYLWSNNATSYYIYDIPVETTTYTVTVTNTDYPNCVDVVSLTVEVLPKPEIPVAFASSNTVCQGGTVTITVQGITDNLIWNTGESGPSITISQGGWYQVTHVGDNGCSSLSEWIFVSNEFIPYVYTFGDGVICGQESETICVNFGDEFIWSNGSTESCIEVMPETLTNYSVTVTSSGSCVHELETSIAVASDDPPGAVSNMLPPDGVQGVALPVQFSWSPADNTTHYDVYIWEESGTEPTFPTYTTTQITSTYFGGLQFATTYNWKVCARNSCSTAAPVCSNAQQFTLNELPDLVVDQINAPLVAFSGTEFVVNWDVSNIGTGSTNNISTNATWYDVCYLSADSMIGGNDTYLGSRFNPSALSVGGFYTSPDLDVNLPDGIQGDYFFIVCVDRFDNMPEVNEENNCRISSMPINIQLTPPPDLLVQPLPSPTGAGGNVVFPGEQYEIQWTVINRSNGANSGPTLSEWWYDRVYVSADTVFNPQTAQLQSTVYHSGNLEVDMEYNANGSISIPTNALDSIYFYVCTDATNREYEYVFENNNCRRSDLLEVIGLGIPDFDLTSITAPDTASNKAYINVTWTGINEGANFNNNLYDQVYLSSEPDFSAWFTPIGSAAQSINVPNGTTFERQANAYIPNNRTGKHYLLVKTNVNNFVDESNYENNLIVDSIIIVSPNVIVANITTPPTAVSGQNLTFEWEVSNIGAGDLLGSNVTDRIQLLDANNQNVALSTTRSGSITLFSGESQTRQKTVNLPNGLSGKYFIEVHTNYNNWTYENGLFSDNVLVTTDTFMIIMADFPNLIADAITSPTEMATAGDPIDIYFKVENGGDASATGIWNDRIYLSTDASWPLSSFVPLSFETQSQVIVSEGSYEKNISTQLPTSLQAGNYYLYLHTDSGNSVFENNLELDNVKRSAVPIDISIYPLVDLAFVGAPLGPPSISPGETASVYYTVKNNGTVPTTETTWVDGLYLSPNPTWEPSDLLIAEWQRNGALNAGQDYEKLENFTLPAGFNNAFYLCLVIDHENAVGEINENNNFVKILQSNGDTITINYPPQPDLEVQSFEAPDNGIAGQPLIVDYEIRNKDDDGHAVGNWTESVYLSTDEELDGSDLFLHQKNHVGGLNFGQSYSDNMELTLPLGIAGNYFLLIKTDANHLLIEEDETNNVESEYIVITQPPPGDLLVVHEEIQIPSIDTIATEISISWKLSNIGQNPLSGYMAEAVYLSEDAIWDPTDIQLGIWTGTIALDPSASTVHQLTARLENVKRQAYYVFVKTDLLDHFLEEDETNNCSVGPATVFVEVPELPIGLPVTAATIGVELPIYYRIEIPTDTIGETMRVNLTGISDELAFNELYLSRNEIPTRSNHEYGFDVPFEESQEIIVPAVGAGTYYLMAYAVDGEPVQNIELLAEIIPFQITSIQANQGGNTGTMTALLTGAKFEEGMTVWLENPTLGNVVAQKVTLTSSAAAFVTFPLDGQTIGLYDVKAQNAMLEEAILPDGFEVVTGTIGNEPLLASCSIDVGDGVVVIGVPGLGGVVTFEPSHPSVVRPNQIVPITLRYKNTGDVDVPVPSRIFASIAGFPVATGAAGIGENLQQLPLTFSEQNGPPNVLRPGGVAFITVYSKATQSEGVLKFKLLVN